MHSKLALLSLNLVLLFSLAATLAYEAPSDESPIEAPTHVVPQAESHSNLVLNQKSPSDSAVVLSDAPNHIASVAGYLELEDNSSFALVNYESEVNPAVPNWPKPTSLMKELEKLKEIPQAEAWSSVTLNILKLLSETPIDSADIDRQIELLSRQQQMLSNIAQSLWRTRSAEAARHASDISRMNYQLGRRVLVWKELRKSYLSSLDRPAQNPISTSSFGRLSFDGLDPRWVEYLLLPEFKRQLESTSVDEKDQRDVARRILSRIYSPILDDEQSRYVNQIIDPSVIEFLKQQAVTDVDYVQLIKRLEQYDQRSSSYAGYFLNDQYHNLLWSPHSEDQAVVKHLETHYRNANVRLSLSERLMNRLIPELPSTLEPVSENVDGAKIRGQSHISNQIRVDVIPNPSKAMLQLETTGFVHADTVARTRTFRVQNEGQASFQVFKQIAFGVDGIDASSSPFSHADARQDIVQLQSSLDNVPVFGAVARKLAAKKLREDASRNNQYFKNKVTNSAEQRVERELEENLAKLRAYSANSLLQPLIAMELEPQPIQMSTTETQFIARYRLAGRDQMAANTARPQDSGSSLISFQVHQSALNNAIARLGLNGTKFDSEGLKTHLQEEIGLKPKEDSKAAPEKDAEFTFAAFDPIRVDLENDRFNVVLNLKGLKIGEKGKTWKNISLTASYKAESDGMKINLTQDDEGTRIQGRRLKIGDKAAISAVMKVLFKKSYTFNALPKKMYERFNGDQLLVSQLVTSNGWISVSIDDLNPESQPSNERPMVSGLKRILNRR